MDPVEAKQSFVGFQETQEEMVKNMSQVLSDG